MNTFLKTLVLLITKNIPTKKTTTFLPYFKIVKD